LINFREIFSNASYIMKLKTCLSLFVVLLFGFDPEIMAQQEGSRWYFGSYAGLQFINDTVYNLSGSAMWDNDNSSTICDPAGNLLFYTNSVTIWNRNHQVMMNGDNLLGSTTSGQCGIIVPQPGTSKFYIFTNAPFNSSAGLSYSKVDMNEDNGKGAVTIKNSQLFPFTTEKLDAIYDSLSNSYWVVAHPFASEHFYAYRITSYGLDENPVISDPCAYYAGGNPASYNAIGQMTISPNGKMIASGVLSDGYIELCDFDMGSGRIYNSRIIQGFPDAWGIAFSPNSKVLYAVKWWTDNVFQFDLSDTSITAITASKTLIGHATASNAYGYQAGYMQLGPDRKLYIARYDEHYLARIDFPDILGLECGFVNDGVYLGSGTSTAGLSRVPVRPGIPLGATEPVMNSEPITIIPNPASEQFRIQLPGNEIKVHVLMINAYGLPLKMIENYVPGTVIKTEGIAPGLYLIRVTTGEQNCSGKLIIK